MPDPTALPPRVPRLGAGQIHVWSADLDEHARLETELAATLSTDERERAAGFRRRGDGLRFTLRRGILRVLLAAYLGREPRALRFAYGLYGKPALALAPATLSFNLAEAAGLALFAITLEPTVGVDLEPLRAAADAEELGPTALSPAERERLLRVPPAGRGRAFLECWTRKEAYLKALGDGLVRAPDQVDLARVAGEWKIESIAPAAGYVGAVAARGDGWRLWRCRW